MMPGIDEIFSHFNAPGTIKDHKAYGKGHINDTYLIITEGYGNESYILQRINHHVFRNVPQLMHNIQTVTDHILNKRSKENNHPGKCRGLQLVETVSRENHFKDEDGNFWRCFHFIENAIIYENTSNPELAYEAGKAIGNFQLMLADLDAQLYETLPSFHSFSRRYEEYLQARKVNFNNRLAKSAGEIDFIDNRLAGMTHYFESLKKEEIPVRVTHNDTKINNIVFDQDNKAVCLIDLDTVMPGYIHFDYGDALRTLANTTVEDEGDISRVNFNFPLFEAFTDGYLETAGTFLLEQEKRLLAFAPLYMTFLIGLRFLNDYLNGDIYYKVSSPEHNLGRARVQFRLVEHMEDQYENMKKVFMKQP